MGLCEQDSGSECSSVATDLSAPREQTSSASAQQKLAKPITFYFNTYAGQGSTRYIALSLPHQRTQERRRLSLPSESFEGTVRVVRISSIQKSKTEFEKHQAGSTKS
jgi:hypothetical protein